MRVRFSSFVCGVSTFICFASAEVSAQAPMSFEDTTRENTVDAYMAFIGADPKGDQVARAYELQRKVLPAELSIKDKLSPRGTASCSVTRTVSDAARLMRRTGGQMPQELCTAFERVQTIKNTTAFPLLVRPTGDPPLILLPGKSHKTSRVLTGSGCKGPAIGKKSGKYVAKYSCSKKPSFDAGKPLVSIVALLPAEAQAYVRIMENKDALAARDFRDSYPSSPVAYLLKEQIEPWLKEEQDRLLASVAVKVRYTKKRSSDYRNPYELELRNTNAFQVQVTMRTDCAAEPCRGDLDGLLWLTLDPNGTFKLERETKKGGEARFKVEFVSREIVEVPSTFACVGASEPLQMSLSFSGDWSEAAGRYVDGQISESLAESGPVLSVASVKDSASPDGRTVWLGLSLRTAAGKSIPKGLDPMRSKKGWGRYEGVSLRWSGGTWTAHEMQAYAGRSRDICVLTDAPVPVEQAAEAQEADGAVGADGGTPARDTAAAGDTPSTASGTEPGWLRASLRESGGWRAEVRVERLVVGEASGVIEYKKFRCGGELHYTGRADDDGYTFRQQITHGRCTQGCQFVLSAGGDGYREVCRGSTTGSGRFDD